MRFQPKANQVLVLKGAEYLVKPHPNAYNMAFCAEAGRAHVFKLQQCASAELYALKVFKPRFRCAGQAISAPGLSSFSSFRGMQAARREIIAPVEPIVETFPDLACAVLMPWVNATTWQDILVRAANTGFRLSPHVALTLIVDFLGVMETLEKAEFAHTDISAGNVMVDMERQSIHLLDLEDACFPGATRPATGSSGTPGYCHRSGGFWGACADRHASAVLAAEMILLTSSSVAEISDAGLFAPTIGDPGASGRIAEFFELGPLIAPNLAARIRTAFSSPSLNDCPRLAELAASARQDLDALRPAVTPPFVWVEFRPHSGLPPPVVIWEPIAQQPPSPLPWNGALWSLARVLRMLGNVFAKVVTRRRSQVVAAAILVGVIARMCSSETPPGPRVVVPPPPLPPPRVIAPKGGGELAPRPLPDPSTLLLGIGSGAMHALQEGSDALGRGDIDQAKDALSRARQEIARYRSAGGDARELTQKLAALKRRLRRVRLAQFQRQLQVILREARSPVSPNTAYVLPFSRLAALLAHLEASEDLEAPDQASLRAQIEEAMTRIKKACQTEVAFSQRRQESSPPCPE